ncbi:MAG: DJ-1/PfpI family protein [Lachnospiraceae bacterium]|nr:DJ-1/PfpI family protein [Lachnospiraceae bacterium]
MAQTAVFLAEGFEEIEALTVVDLLRRARIGCGTVSVGPDRMVTGSHKITVTADLLFDQVDFDALDMIILPGGAPGTENLRNFKPLTDRVTEFDAAGRYISAICAAPTIFGQLGLLKGKKACCYPGLEDKLEGADVSMDSVCVDGHITTSRGMGTAIDFALAIIERFQGTQAAEDMALRVVYG